MNPIIFFLKKKKNIHLGLILRPQTREASTVTNKPPRLLYSHDENTAFVEKYRCSQSPIFSMSVLCFYIFEIKNKS